MPDRYERRRKAKAETLRRKAMRAMKYEGMAL